MIELTGHKLAGDPITVYAIESEDDHSHAWQWFVDNHDTLLAWDTESSSFQGMYLPSWRMRMFQFGSRDTAFCIPAEHKDLIMQVLNYPRRWLTHNLPHDCLTVHLGLGMDTDDLMRRCTDVRILSHHMDSRNRKEGGVGQKLKDLADAYVDPHAKDFEHRMKKESFPRIKVPVPGEFYKTSNSKTGAVKGEPKMRRALLKDCWGAIPFYDPNYLMYSGVDCMLTVRVFEYVRVRLVEEYGSDVLLRSR